MSEFYASKEIDNGKILLEVTTHPAGVLMVDISFKHRNDWKHKDQMVIDNMEDLVRTWLTPPQEDEQ